MTKTYDAAELRELANDLKGKSFAFFGEFAFWPSYHRFDPEDTARHHGACIMTDVDEHLDFLVLGDRKGSGRAEAKKKATALQKQAARAASKGLVLSCPQIIDESMFREMFRIDLNHKTFAFFGGFDCCGGEMDKAMLSAMVESVGAIVVCDVDSKLDYLVLGNRRGDGKISASNQARRLQADGVQIKVLDEAAFLDLVRTDKTLEDAGDKMDFPTFISRLHGTVDHGKLGRAMKMLKSESFNLYVNKTDKQIVGVVRSQSGGGTVYSSWLTDEGKYGCSTPDLQDCMGLQGTVCKHLLVLLVGLTRSGDMDAQTAYSWVHSAVGKRPRADADLAAHTFLQYKGAESGEIDWRPTQTIPEDFYAF